MLKTKDIREEVESYVHAELGRVRAFCESLAVIREISPRSHDMVIGCGERISAGLLSGVLREEGIDSEQVDLSRAFSNGGLDCSKSGYHHQAKSAFKPYLDAVLAKHKVPVVTGYFEGGIIQDVGRGYTELNCSLVCWCT